MTEDGCRNGKKKKRSFFQTDSLALVKAHSGKLM